MLPIKSFNPEQWIQHTLGPQERTGIGSYRYKLFNPIYDESTVKRINHQLKYVTQTPETYFIYGSPPLSSLDSLWRYTFISHIYAQEQRAAEDEQQNWQLFFKIFLTILSDVIRLSLLQRVLFYGLTLVSFLLMLTQSSFWFLLPVIALIVCIVFQPSVESIPFVPELIQVNDEAYLRHRRGKYLAAQQRLTHLRQLPFTEIEALAISDGTVTLKRLGFSLANQLEYLLVPNWALLHLILPSLDDIEQSLRSEQRQLWFRSWFAPTSQLAAYRTYLQMVLEQVQAERQKLAEVLIVRACIASQATSIKEIDAIDYFSLKAIAIRQLTASEQAFCRDESLTAADWDHLRRFIDQQNCPEQAALIEHYYATSSLSTAELKRERMNNAEVFERDPSEIVVAEILGKRQVSRPSIQQYIHQRYAVLCLRQGSSTIIGGQIQRVLGTYSRLVDQVRHRDTANFLSDIIQSLTQLKTLYDELTHLVNLTDAELTQAFILMTWLQPSSELINAVKTVLISKKAGVRWLLDEALVRLREILDQQSIQLHLSPRLVTVPEYSTIQLGQVHPIHMHPFPEAPELNYRALISAVDELASISSLDEMGCPEALLTGVKIRLDACLVVTEAFSSDDLYANVQRIIENLTTDQSVSLPVVQMVGILYKQARAMTGTPDTGFTSGPISFDAHRLQALLEDLVDRIAATITTYISQAFSPAIPSQLATEQLYSCFYLLSLQQQNSRCMLLLERQAQRLMLQYIQYILADPGYFGRENDELSQAWQAVYFVVKCQPKTAVSRRNLKALSRACKAQNRQAIAGIQTALTAALQMTSPDESIAVVDAQPLVLVSSSVRASLSSWFLSWSQQHAQQTGIVSSHESDQSQVTIEGTEPTY